MSITLNAVDVVHERRVRLIFSRTLDTGAFGAPAPAAYVITCLDSNGSDPGISAAMIITGNPSVVELALSTNLVRGSLYNISAPGIPATDASVTDTPTDMEFRYGVNIPLRDVEPNQLLDRGALVYGTDLLWNGEDYQETASGDLDRVSGTANVTKALYRGLESQGLTWDQTYGAHVRDFVDSPSTASGTLKGAVAAQVLRDPRVKRAKVEITTDDEETYLVITPTLISGEALKQVSIIVPG
jgi:hypothetical protein